MRRLLPGLVLLAFVGCSSASAVGTTGDAGEASTEDFAVTIAQTATPEVFRGDRSADVKFDLAIVNRTSEPYAIERITLQSLAGGTYYVPPNSRKFGKTIAPGAEEHFAFWTTTYVTETTAKAPLTLRATIEARGADSGTERQEVFTQRLNGRVQVRAAWMWENGWSTRRDPALWLSGAKQLEWRYNLSLDYINQPSYPTPAY